MGMRLKRCGASPLWAQTREGSRLYHLWHLSCKAETCWRAHLGLARKAVLLPA